MTAPLRPARSADAGTTASPATAVGAAVAARRAAAGTPPEAAAAAALGGTPMTALGGTLGRPAGAASRRGVVLAGAGLLLAACAGRIYAARPLPVDVAAAAGLADRFRAANGLPPVAPDGRLAAIAAEQAMAMATAGRMSHSLGWGRGLPSRLAAGGYDWEVTAENLGAGYPTLAAAFAGWTGSSGHRANLLKEGVTEFGIAAAESPGSEYRYFWAMILAAPRRPPPGAPVEG